LSSPTEQEIERIHQEQLAAIRKRRAILIGTVLAAAAAAIFAINHHADEQTRCADSARDQMLKWIAGKRISELNLSYDDLRAMQKKHYEDCMAGKKP